MTTTKVESRNSKVENQHTPGPWTIEWSDESVGYHVNGPEKEGGWREIIAETVSGNAIANARLIAAAPDLLAACRAVLEFENTDPLPEFVFEQVQAAIAKAEGTNQ